MRAPSFLASLIAGAVLSFSGIAHAQSKWDPRPYESQLLQWNISLNRIHEDLMKQVALFFEFLTDNKSASPTDLDTAAMVLLGVFQNATKPKYLISSPKFPVNVYPLRNGNLYLKVRGALILQLD